MNSLRKLIAASVLTLLTLANTTAEEPAAPTMPDEVTLTTGRVLRNVEVVRWENGRVVLKYTGGVDPIAFSLFKSPTPIEVSAMQVAARKAARAVTAPKNRVVTGQVFVTTRGAGAYKFAGTQVLALSQSYLSVITSAVDSALSSAKTKAGMMGTFDPAPVRYFACMDAVKNLNPVASANTDADGMFQLAITSKEPVFLFCASRRLAGGSEEYNVWMVPVDKADRIDLNNANLL